MSELESIYMDQLKRLEQIDENEKETGGFLLAFDVVNCSFCVFFEQVREIIDYHPFTEYPQDFPGHIGIINFRGSVVPIVWPFKGECVIPTEDRFDEFRYIIFEDRETGELVGIYAQNVRKVEIHQSQLAALSGNDLLRIDNEAIRYVEVDSFFKDFICSGESRYDGDYNAC